MKCYFCKKNEVTYIPQKLEPNAEGVTFVPLGKPMKPMCDSCKEELETKMKEIMEKMNG